VPRARDVTKLKEREEKNYIKENLNKVVLE
jgi:hypothetical protein